MAGKAFKNTTVPSPFQMSGTAGRPKLKASAQALAAVERLKEEAREVVELQRQERRLDVREAETHLARVQEAATERGEDAERTQAGPLHVLARDGLMWAMRKGHIGAVHYDAGLRFRAAYETANGTGVKSCLADPGSASAFGPKSGPTDAMLRARGEVRDALASLGTPLLTAYVQLLAGEGVTLSDPRFGDPKRVGDHVLPCRVAFDLLARGYGMIR